MKEIMGRRYGFSRLAYSCFSLLSLLPVIYYQLNIEHKVIWTWPGPWHLAKYALYGASFLLFYGGFRVYDIQHMLGLKKIYEMQDGRNAETSEFTADGILGYVRHPWYSVAILLIWAYDAITDVSLVSKTVLTAYIIIGTLLEEKKLVYEFGEAYLSYQKKVPMLIPRLRKDLTSSHFR